MDLELTNKIAIVTGSSRGLGLASAAALVREGCRVTICARGGPRLAEAAAELQQLARAPKSANPAIPANPENLENTVLAVVADLATPEGTESVVTRTVDVFGGVDILVHNVGLARGAGIADTRAPQCAAAFEQTLSPAIR